MDELYEKKFSVYDAGTLRKGIPHVILPNI